MNRSQTGVLLTELRILVDLPLGNDGPSFTYLVHDEQGEITEEGEYGAFR